MLFSIIVKRFFTLTICTALLGLHAMPLQAAMLSTEQIIEQHSGLAKADALQTALARDDVRQRLVEMGIDPAQAEKRIAKLTDQQISELNQRLDELPAGGDALGLIVLIFLVFVITDAVGATDIFPFVHPITK